IVRLKNPAIRLLADLRTPQGARQFLDHDRYPAMCLTATRRWLTANPDKGRKIADCFLEANRWMLAHTPEQIREALPPEARAADAQADVEALKGILPTIETNGRIELADAQAVYRVVAASVPAVRDAGIDLRQTVL